MRIVFAGSSPAAVTTLSALATNSNFEIAAVYTQVDRKIGRGLKVKPKQVKELSLAHNLKVEQPLTFKDAATIDTLKNYAPDILVVVSYGMLLPTSVLSIPKFGCWNMHFSLLPRWRGAAPIQRAIEAGDKKTGICIMQMDAGLDTGHILAKQEVDILETDTALALHDKLADLGAGLLLDCLDKVHDLEPTPQADSGVCYAKKLNKAAANINWQLPATEIEQKIRAFNPWPICFTTIDDVVVRVWQAEISDRKYQQVPGTIVAADKNGIVVATSDGCLNLLQIQLPNAKVLPSQSVLHSKSALFKPGKLFS